MSRPFAVTLKPAEARAMRAGLRRYIVTLKDEQASGARPLGITLGYAMDALATLNKADPDMQVAAPSIN